MKLFLFRHGHAAPSGPDASPCLTPKGRQEVTRMAEYFKAHHQPFQHLWHSPKTRAAETAQLFLSIAGYPKVQIEEKDGLKPDGDVHGIYQELTGLKIDSLLVVTHLPFVADLAAQLAEGSPQARAELVFPTAGLAAFERHGRDWKWLWSMDPSSLK